MVLLGQSRSKKNWNNANDRWRVICPRERMVGRQGLAHLRTDTHRNGRKVNVSSFFAICCASVRPQCCREFPCMMERDDRDVGIGGPYDDVVGVSNIIYDLGVEADAGVFFGVVAIQHVNGLHASLHHLQRRSVDIRQDGQHRYDVRVWYVRMPAPSTHSVGM